jgi:hypothetical protein
MGFIKKHFMGLDQMKDTEASAPKQRFGQRGAENNHRNDNKGIFAGVPCQKRAFEPRSPVKCPLISIDAFESDQLHVYSGNNPGNGFSTIVNDH